MAFTAIDLSRLRQALPGDAELAPCEPGALQVTFDVSIDRITLISRPDRVDWEFERNPIVEWNRAHGSAPDILTAMREALACAD
jgi:hypothetical protein